MQTTELYSKLLRLENELKILRKKIGKLPDTPKQLVSLRSIGKLLVSKKDLDKIVQDAKKSLFR